MSPQRKIEHSQNFIRRPGLVKELLALTGISTSDLVLEIGPGKGMITEELVKKAGRVLAIERDPRFSAKLSLLASRGNFQLVISDFLEWQLPSEKYKIFANIPFNYTADIVNKLTSSEHLPTDIYLIMQKAAAQRFAGMPYHANSLISILIGLDFLVRILCEIDQSNFEPKPNVDIVFVHFGKYDRAQFPRAAISDDERQLFRDFIIYGYTQWGETVLDAYKKIFTYKQQSIIAKAQKLEGLKPTDLTLDQWINLFKTFRSYVSDPKKHLVQGSEVRLNNQQQKLNKIHRTQV